MNLLDFEIKLFETFNNNKKFPFYFKSCKMILEGVIGTSGRSDIAVDVSFREMIVYRFLFSKFRQQLNTLSVFKGYNIQSWLSSKRHPDLHTHAHAHNWIANHIDESGIDNHCSYHSDSTANWNSNTTVIGIYSIH